uniref:Uncharacterized protein n=1 Tax=Helianthus annuus TaxID=4232 RepID=A0A251UT55_HELAN
MFHTQPNTRRLFISFHDTNFLTLSWSSTMGASVQISSNTFSTSIDADLRR